MDRKIEIPARFLPGEQVWMIRSNCPQQVTLLDMQILWRLRDMDMVVTDKATGVSRIGDFKELKRFERGAVDHRRSQLSMLPHYTLGATRSMEAPERRPRMTVKQAQLLGFSRHTLLGSDEADTAWFPEHLFFHTPDELIDSLKLNQ